jgi:hypothetical protein
MRCLKPTLPLAVLSCLAGCGASAPTSVSPPLGRLFSAEQTLSSAAVSAGDPLEERDGTVQQRLASKQNTPSWSAPSPQAALLRYALLYTNWQASSLPARERELASLAVGVARLTAEQDAASQSAAATLRTNHVQNKGVVLSIAAGRVPARGGHWIVVTEERTTGIGPYAGLPPTLHVTFARVERVSHGWAVSEWSSRTN